MIDLWWDEARRNDVLPLDNRPLERDPATRGPRRRGSRDRYVYRPFGAPVPEAVGGAPAEPRAHDHRRGRDPGGRRSRKASCSRWARRSAGSRSTCATAACATCTTSTRRSGTSIGSDEVIAPGAHELAYAFTKTTGLRRARASCSSTAASSARARSRSSRRCRSPDTGGGLTCGYEVGPGGRRRLRRAVPLQRDDPARRRRRRRASTSATRWRCSRRSCRSNSVAKMAAAARRGHRRAACRVVGAHAAGAQSRRRADPRVSTCVITIEPDGTLQIHESITYDFGDRAAPRDPPRPRRSASTYDEKHDRRYDDRRRERHRRSRARRAQCRRARTARTCACASAIPTRRSPACTRYHIVYTVRGAPLTFADHDELNWDAIGNQWPVPISNAHVTVDAPAPDHAASRASRARRAARLPCDRASAHGHARRRSRSGRSARARASPSSSRCRRARSSRRRADPRDSAKTLANAFEVTPLTVGLGGGLARRSASARRGRARDATRPRPPLHRLGGRRRDGQHDGRGGAAPALRTAIDGPVEFVPPDGIRPGQVGTLVDEHANLLDVTASIVDLAVRGWLTITELEPEAHDRHPDYELDRDAGQGQGRRCSRTRQLLLHELFDDRATREALRSQVQVPRQPERDPDRRCTTTR